MQISQKQKELLTWNKKHFSSLLKGFHWSKQKNKFFLEGESPTLILNINNVFEIKV